MSEAERERRAIARVAQRIAKHGVGRSTLGAMYFRAGKSYGARELRAARHDIKRLYTSLQNEINARTTAQGK